jgi:hypothetical protein
MSKPAALVEAGVPSVMHGVAVVPAHLQHHDRLSIAPLSCEHHLDERGPSVVGIFVHSDDVHTTDEKIASVAWNWRSPTPTIGSFVSSDEHEHFE